MTDSYRALGTCCVYKITHIATGKAYIGNLRKRGYTIVGDGRHTLPYRIVTESDVYFSHCNISVNRIH